MIVLETIQSINEHSREEDRMETITILEVHPRMEPMLKTASGANVRTTGHWGTFMGPGSDPKTWKHQKECWIAQNKMLHHGTASSILTSAATKSVLLERIRALYSHEENILIQDRHPFLSMVEDWATKTVNEMKQWVGSQ
eukprot:scaffold56233_cov76-Attheya_sp.AAC.2